MATDKRKRAIRALAAEHGISYTTAMRMHDGDSGQALTALHPASPDYALDNVGLDLSSPALVVGGEESGKTVVAASLAKQARERGMRVEFLTRDTGLDGAEATTSLNEFMERIATLRQELTDRKSTWKHHRDKALDTTHPSVPEKETAPLSLLHDILNEQGLPPILVVDDDMPHSIQSRSVRRQYLDLMGEVATQGADLGFFLLTTRTEALDAFLPGPFLEAMGDVILLGEHKSLPNSLNGALSSRGLDVEGLKATTSLNSWNKGVLTYQDHYERIDLRSTLMGKAKTTPIWNGNTHPDPLTFYLGTAPTGGPFSVPLSGERAHLFIIGNRNTGRSTLAEQIAAQALIKPMPWDPALRAEVYTLDPWGEANSHWSRYGAKCVLDPGPDGVLTRLQEIEGEHQRRLTILADHPDASTWEDLPESVKRAEHLAPIVAVLDDVLDTLEGPDRRDRSEADRKSLLLLRKWRDEGHLTGVVLVLTSVTLGRQGNTPNTYCIFTDSNPDTDSAEQVHSARMSNTSGKSLFLPMRFGSVVDALDRWLSRASE